MWGLGLQLPRGPPKLSNSDQVDHSFPNLYPTLQVDSTKYYEACVSDACACDSGGDCECFCTAVAAYAQACHDVGVCVSWRTPDICREWGSVRGAEGLSGWG